MAIYLWFCVSPNDVNGIVELLKKEKKIALKLISGSLGTGFYKLIHEDNKFYVNTEEKTLEEVKTLIGDNYVDKHRLEGYLVTEYLVSHESIRKIFDVTPNTLRVQLIRDEGKKPEVVGAFIRFGTKNTGVLETPTVGGIIAGVDIRNGVLYDPVMLQGHSFASLDKHPDTNESFEITLPHWDEIKQKLLEISDYLPSLSYLGFDIIITDTGFKIIEINSLTSVAILSYYYPFFKNKYAKEYFLRKFKQNPKNFKRVLKMLEE